MARYDQGGGCACGLRRDCDCGSGQADGSKPRRDRSDPEGGIPGRYAAGDVCGRQNPLVEAFRSPQARGRARRNKHETERTKRRIAELDEQSRIVRAVQGLSPRALKVWERLKAGKWYRPFDRKCPAAMDELEGAGLVIRAGSPMVIAARWFPVGTEFFKPEVLPRDLP